MHLSRRVDAQLCSSLRDLVDLPITNAPEPSMMSSTEDDDSFADDSGDSSGIPPTYAYTAYERSFLGDTRYIEKMLNVLIIIIALVLNLLLACFGLASLFGVYATLLFLFALFICDAVLARPSIVQHTLNCQYSASSHLHTPLVYNETLLFIGVWLLWWFTSTLLYEAGALYTFGSVQIVGMLFIAVVCAWSDVIGSNNGTVSYAVRLLVDVHAIFMLAALAFPTETWAPQYTSALQTSLRVVLYFIGVFIADYALVRVPLVASDVHSRAERIATLDYRHVNSSTDLVYRRAALCSALALYEQTRQAGRERGKRIVALTAWMLFASPIVIIFFSIFLVLSRFIFFMVREREAEAVANSRTKSTESIENGTGGLANVHSKRTTTAAAAASGDSEALAMRNTEESFMGGDREFSSRAYFAATNMPTTDDPLPPTPHAPLINATAVTSDLEDSPVHDMFATSDAHSTPTGARVVAAPLSPSNLTATTSPVVSGRGAKMRGRITHVPISNK